MQLKACLLVDNFPVLSVVLKFPVLSSATTASHVLLGALGGLPVPCAPRPWSSLTSPPPFLRLLLPPHPCTLPRIQARPRKPFSVSLADATWPRCHSAASPVVSSVLTGGQPGLLLAHVSQLPLMRAALSTPLIQCRFGLSHFGAFVFFFFR